MRANRTLPIGTTTWRVLATFDFDNQDLSGRAALVEGATLLLLRPDTLLEAIPLVELELIGEANPVHRHRPGAVPGAAPAARRSHPRGDW